jgi:hypothetical protein
MTISDAEFQSRWANGGLRERYDLLHGRPRPVEEPPVAVSLPLRNVAFSEEDVERRARDLRTARAMIELDRALAEEAKEAEHERRTLLDGSAIGLLMRGA